MKRTTIAKLKLPLIAATFPLPLFSAAWAQTSAGVSNYVFRFNTGVSSVFLSDMAFQKEQPLDLGRCTVVEKLNGPLSCALNCDNQAVCLLDLSGPSGSSVNDVMELVSETPVSGGAPSPTPSATAFGAIRSNGPNDLASDLSRRVDAYNQHVSH